MRRRVCQVTYRRLFITCFALALAASRSMAQSAGSDSAGTDSSCTYIRCVLFISRSPHGSDRLLIGSLGRSETLGFSGGAVSRAVTAVPAAVAAATAGRQSRISVRMLTYASFSAMGYLAISRGMTRKGPPVLANFIGFTEGAGRGLLIVVPAVLMSIPLERRANRHFDRAVSLYNERLPH